MNPAINITKRLVRGTVLDVMKLITTKDAAERLGVTVQRVHALIRDGRLPAERLGRDYVIREEDLALVADRKPGRPPAAEVAKKAVAKKSTKKSSK